MVSMMPYTQSLDMSQMYNFSNKNIESIIYNENSLMFNINTNKDLTIFSHIIKKAGYDIKFSDKQANITLFVSSDRCLLKKYSCEFIKNIDKGLAIQMLNCCAMNRELDKNLLQSSPIGTYPTLDRSNNIEISTVCGVTLLNNHIKVIHWNYKAINGLIHVTDDFLFPSSYGRII